MAFPYSSGEVLTAANLNASSGLVLVSDTAIGSGVSSVTVNNAFSSTFDNYRVIWNVEAGSAAAAGIYLTFGSTTSGYYAVRINAVWAGTLSGISAGGSQITIGAIQGTGGGSGVFDVLNPYNSLITSVHMSTIRGSSTSGYVDQGGGMVDNSTSYTSFKLAPASGTITNGNIRVYGYNNG